jgi:hypothetical protein
MLAVLSVIMLSGRLLYQPMNTCSWFVSQGESTLYFSEYGILRERKADYTQLNFLEAKWRRAFQLQLPFPDDMMQLNASQGCLGTGEAFETQHGPSNFLDEAMIGMPHHLFHDVVQVFTLNHGNSEGKKPCC